MPDSIGSTPATSMTLAVNTSYTYAIDFNGDTDLFRVSLNAGTTYIVDLEGAATTDNRSATLSDPWLALKDAEGNVLLTNDDGGMGTSSRIFYTPSTSGTYYLSAESLGQTGTGTYTIHIGTAPFEGTISVGGTRTAAIDYAGDTDLWQVTLTAGTTYLLDLAGDTLGDPFLELLDGSRAMVQTDDDAGIGLNSSIIFTPTVSGTYYLAARESGNDATGTYRLSVRLPPSISVADTNVTEPDAGTTDALFVVTLSDAMSRDVTVKYRTADDIAVAGRDFASASGEIVVPAGSTRATFSVSVLGDTVFEPREAFAIILSNPVNATISDGVGFGIIEDNDRPASIEFPVDRNFPWEWYIFSPFGANVLPVWKDYSGNAVRVAVFDQGIDSRHPDLDGNLLSALGRDAATLSGNGLPKQSNDNHGTIVAGVIAAENDGTGTVGVAYGADLVSIYSPLNEPVSIFGSRVANAYSYALETDSQIVNDSWGYAALFLGGANFAFVDNFASANFAAAGQQLYNLAARGRGGLGTVVVQAAGNSYGYGDDTNLHNFQNSRYIITVAASDYFGQATDYSSPGVSVLVTAPGGRSGGASGIISTDRVGSAGFTATDYGFFAGTSLAAPIVSGVVALMLEANSNLGYRDVQEILAYSARQIGTAASNWQSNGANNWNGGGLHFDAGLRQFGFGLVDALAAVRLAETWGAAHTVANLQELGSVRAPGAAIPDNDTAGVSDSLSVAQHMQIERVDIVVNITHPFIGDLSIALDSPGGTRSWLLQRPGEGPYSAVGSSQADIHFSFDTVANWGEDSAGEWRLTVQDRSAGNTGRFDSWQLILTGKPLSADDLYIYTDEFATANSGRQIRTVLADTGGTDTINAAAVTTALALNLAPGSTSTIDGRSFLIQSGTVIENAFGGDGNDVIIGNDANNRISGMRGDDQLVGGTGNDVLTGGPGNDTLDGGTGIDTAVFSGNRATYNIARNTTGYTLSSGPDGEDQLTNIERLQFGDKKVALDLDGAAGNTAKLIAAAFGPRHVSNAGGVAIGLGLFDAGMTMQQVAELALDSLAFRQVAGSRSNTDVVNQLYAAVVGIRPSSSNLAFFVGLLDDGTRQADLLVFAANTEINSQNINLVGLSQTGIEFA